MSCENFIHEQFSTDGVSLFQRVISTEERNILLGFVGGETGGDPIVQGFINPVGSDLSSITSQLTSAVGDGEDIIGYLEGVVGAEDLLAKAQALQTQIGSFKGHTDRLSGVDLEVGEEGLPNIAGVAGMASAFTDAKSMMSAADAPVEDNFSQMFGSIAGGGQKLVTDALSITNSISNLDLTDPAAILAMGTSLDDIGCKMEIAQGSDIDAFDAAGKYINKLSVAQNVISMNQSSNFNKVLGDLVTKPDLKEKIQNIPQLELPNIGIGSEYKIPEIPEL